MKLNELKRNPNSTKTRKVVGRGPGSGHGKTSGRGEKGQKARSGATLHSWFEGGQTPLFKTIPRRGFNNKRFTKRYSVINVGDLNRFKDDTVVTPELLKSEKIIKKELTGLKVLGNGTLERKLIVKANIFTNSAINKIEQSGGKTEVI